MKNHTRGVQIRISDCNGSKTSWEENAWKEIVAQTAKLQKDQLFEFFRLTTSSRDRKNIILRAAIISGLQTGKSYRKLSYELGASTQTVASIMHALTTRHYLPYQVRTKDTRKPRRAIPAIQRTSGSSIKQAHKTKYGTVYF